MTRDNIPSDVLLPGRDRTLHPFEWQLMAVRGTAAFGPEEAEADISAALPSDVEATRGAARLRRFVALKLLHHSLD